LRCSQELAAVAPALTRAVQRIELQTPPGDALFGTDTSGLAQSYILYSGREVLPIGGYLGNVPAPTLATLRSRWPGDAELTMSRSHPSPK